MDAVRSDLILRQSQKERGFLEENVGIRENDIEDNDCFGPEPNK